MTELKSCPFCGADPCNLSINHDEMGAYIYCATCDSIYSNANEGNESLVNGWNRRTLSEDDVLAISNAWLDCERFACDLSQKE